VRERTGELQAANRAMQAEIGERRRVQVALEHERSEQQALIRKLEDAHLQLTQSEKMASIGQLAAGVAHEINNPIGFVGSNLGTLDGYARDLLELLDAYAAADPLLVAQPELRERIAAIRQRADLDYLRADLPTLIRESRDGIGRVRKIVQDLKDFSRVGETRWQLADLHQGLDSTLNVVWNELKYKAEVVRDYGTLPLVECLPGQINQVFMNLLVNAAQALDQRGTITLRTRADAEVVTVAVADTGSGIPTEIRARIFEPFFTTKPVGKGTGLGLSISFGIVQRHGGEITVDSVVGQGTTFAVRLPVRQAPAGAAAATGDHACAS
jgi:two-component system NtrC family sensor kinase